MILTTWFGYRIYKTNILPQKNYLVFFVGTKQKKGEQETTTCSPTPTMKMPPQYGCLVYIRFNYTLGFKYKKWAPEPTETHLNRDG